MKKFFLLGSLLFIFLCFNHVQLQAKSFKDEVVYERYAKLVNANYVNEKIMIKLIIDDVIYTGTFKEELSIDDYLFFHHNEGLVFNVTFIFEKQQLIILKWYV